MFNERGKDFGIFFVGDQSSGDKLKDTITDGDDVTLKVGEEQITVRNLIILCSGRYRGTISGFDPSRGVAFQELTLGQEVEFAENHIYTCSTA